MAKKKVPASEFLKELVALSYDFTESSDHEYWPELMEKLPALISIVELSISKGLSFVTIDDDPEENYLTINHGYHNHEEPFFPPKGRSVCPACDRYLNLVDMYEPG